MGLVGIAAGTAGTVLAVAATIGTIAARKSIVPRPRKRVRVLDADERSITLAVDPLTRAPGTYRAYLEDGRSILIGTVLHETAGGVRRAVLPGSASSAPGDTLLWTGYLIDDPTALAVPVREVALPGSAGVRSSWLYDMGGSTTWAIHVHGIHSKRSAILRAVPTTLDAGMTSLVIPYRHDAEDDNSGPATFGQAEWQDLDAAMHYAVGHGAERIVLVGWSMGATISLIASRLSSLGDLVSGMVLISPAVDWHAALRAGARKSGFPAFFGSLAAGALLVPGLAQLAALDRPLQLRWMRLRPPRHLPVLLIHSPGDEDVPIRASRAFARYPGANVRLEEFASAPHGMELNRDPVRFERVVRTFLREIPSAVPKQGYPDPR